MVILEKQNMHRISLVTIGAFMVGGALFGMIYIFVLWNAPWQGLEGFIMLSLVIASLSALCIGCSVYLWRKRKAGKGFWWDDEGIVIDLNENKVCWNEIESIQFSKQYTVPFSKSTVVYPHYTHHEKIRIRRKKWMPTPAHSIDWFMIEKPKEYHEQLMKAWEEKCNALGSKEKK